MRQHILALQAAWQQAFDEAKCMTFSEKRQKIIHSLHIIADELDALLEED